MGAIINPNKLETIDDIRIDSTPRWKRFINNNASNKKPTEVNMDE